ncbi:hypothetical protein RM549_06635 [Salegentibacter sp. F188]|uniref:RING-type E3 ubiquitin transferase n=1 Tax=Autumnicola patrickiae TaxID=3075591 RepID=A0ABU3E0E9_9FLAO|nr:hypothetical protein [Salegentibacter sp. F188]MDT0689452.1 hypothetical protein [Salegentibacter sp. F188]
MIRNYNIYRKFTFFMAPVFLLLLASCGSYEYAGYGNDGIYGATNPDVRYDQRTDTRQDRYVEKENKNSNSSYYKNLFAEKSQMYNDVLENGIFTDVESYSSTEGGQEDEYYDDSMEYTGGYAPWGGDPDEYTVNIYNNGWYGGGFMNPYRWGWGNRFGYGFAGHGGYWGNPYWGGWDPFWGPGFGHPFMGGYGMGFGHPFMGYGMGYGMGFGWGYGGLFNPYFHNRGLYNGGWYGSPYYGDNNRREVAYNEGRRNSRQSYTGRSSRNTSATNARTRNSSYSRSIREIRNNRTADYSGSRSRSVRSSGNDSNIYSRSSSRSTPVRVNSESSRRNSSYERSSPTRNRSTQTRSSTPTRSSSGSVRSSGSSGRSSSGTRSSGGGRSSSRGGRG